MKKRAVTLILLFSSILAFAGSWPESSTYLSLGLGYRSTSTSEPLLLEAEARAKSQLIYFLYQPEMKFAAEYESNFRTWRSGPLSHYVSAMGGWRGNLEHGGGLFRLGGYIGHDWDWKYVHLAYYAGLSFGFNYTPGGFEYMDYQFNSEFMITLGFKYSFMRIDFTFTNFDREERENKDSPMYIVRVEAEINRNYVLFMQAHAKQAESYFIDYKLMISHYGLKFGFILRK